MVVGTHETGFEVHDGWHRTEALRTTTHMALCAVYPPNTGLDEIEREIACIQLQYNTGAHRFEQSSADRFDAIAQMLDLGVSPTETQKRLVGTKREEVSAVKKAKASSTATHAVFENQLDIFQAGLVAEHFGDDPDITQRLVKAAAEGQFEHILQQLLDDRAVREAEERTAAAYAETVARYTAAGITVLDDSESHASYPDGLPALDDLIDADGNTPTADSVPAQYLAVLLVRQAIVDETGQRIGVDLIDPLSYNFPDEDPDPGTYHVADVTLIDEWEPRYYCLDAEATGLDYLQQDDELDNLEVASGDDSDGGVEDPVDRAARLEREAERARQEQLRRDQEAQ